MSNLKAKQTPGDAREAAPAQRRTRPGLLARPQRDADNHKGNDIWLTTLSDLLMLLVIFFVILFGMEMQKPKHATEPPAPVETAQTAVQVKTDNTFKPVAARPETPAPPASVEKELSTILEPGKPGQEIAIYRSANRVTLTFPERIMFDPGHARLKPAARPALDRLALFIKERPQLAVEVQGHTDNRPISNPRYPSNWELSVDRATQVARALIAMGVDPQQLSVKGFGEYHGLFPNNSDENRLKNRRVEIQFTLPTDEMQARAAL
jgi:chemotaxis protein MotB